MTTTEVLRMLDEHEQICAHWLSAEVVSDAEGAEYCKSKDALVTAIAALSAPAAADGEPLTGQQIEQGREEWGVERSDFHAGARFAERHHGIAPGATPGGQQGDGNA